MNFQNVRRSTVLTLVFSLCALFAACTAKDRDTKLTQGQTLTGLMSVSDYQDKEYPIQTFEAMSASETSAFKTEEKSKDNKTYLFPVVRYESSAPFLKAIGGKKWALIGRENTKDIYSFYVQLTDTQMVVYKKARAADLSKAEKGMGTLYSGGKVITDKKQIAAALSSSDKELKASDDSYYLIPQFMMRISLKKIEKVKNGDGEETNVENLFESKNLSDSQYFEPDYTSATMALPAGREFVFEKDFFKGEWFFSAVIVSSLDAPAGYNINADFTLNEASRIQFEIDQYRLSGKNTNVDDGQVDEKTGDVSIESSDVIFIPAESVDFQLETAPTTAMTYREEMLDEKNAKSPNWADRRYVKLNFSGALGVASLISKGGLPNDASLVDLTVENDYLGFTVFYRTQKQTVRYSMKRAHEPAKGRIAFSQDMDKRFGYFTTQKAFVPGPEHVRFNDFTKNIFLNRFYPAAHGEKPNTIVFHFSTSSPKEPAIYRESAREAIKQWNELFQRTAQINVEIDESKDVDLGDIRYNVINLVYEKKNGGGLLGYGPSISDTKSGEIISATANIYVTPFVNMTVRELRSLVYREIGRIQDELVLDPATLSQKIGAELAGWEYSSEPLNYVLARNATIKKETGIEANADGSITSSHSFDLSHREIRKKAAALCQNDLFQYINKVRELNKANPSADLTTFLPKEQNADGTERNVEYEALLSCADRVAFDELVHTTLHELGHNFGLRHNFAASADVKNFTRDFKTSSVAEKGAEAREKASASSVMDYLSPAAQSASILGPYDEAAIRFAYSNQVEVESPTREIGDFSNKYVKVDTSKSLAENERAQGIKLRKYKFCTDEHVSNKYDYVQFSEESLCFRFDWGATATEVAYNIINDINNGMSQGRNRYDLVKARFRDSETFKDYVAAMYLEPLLRVYAGWRGLLAFEIKDRTKINLTDMTEQELAIIIQKGLKNPDKEARDRFADFYAASQLISEFLMKTASLPSRQCLAWDAAGVLHTEDFERLKEVAALEQIKFRDCSDEQVPRWMGINDKNIKAIGAGFNYEDHSYTTEIEERPDWWTADLIGVGQLVGRSAELLRDADAYSITFYNVKLNPIVLQEPKILNRAVQLMRERMLFGVKAIELIPSYQDKKTYLPLFRSIQEPVLSLMNAVTTSLKDQDLMRTQLTYSFSANRTEIPANNPIWLANAQGLGSNFTTATMENKISVELLRKMSELDNLEKMTVSAISTKQTAENVETQVLKMIQEVQARLPGEMKNLSLSVVLKEYIQLRAKFRTDAVMIRALNEIFRSLYENPRAFAAVEANAVGEFANSTKTLEAYLKDFIIPTAEKAFEDFRSPIPEGTLEEVAKSSLKRWSFYRNNREEMKFQASTLERFFSSSGLSE